MKCFYRPRGPEVKCRLRTCKGLGLVLGSILRVNVRVKVSVRVKIRVRVSSSILPYCRSAGLVCSSAATAWEFSQDLGNLGINLGFREFSKQYWEFWYIQEIS